MPKNKKKKENVNAWRKKKENENKKKCKKVTKNNKEKLKDVNSNNPNEKQIKIISNIKLREAVENAKKVLFSEDDDDEEKKENDNNYEIRGTMVNQGLCYICVRNINTSSNGFKCSKCCRAYHQNCIQKQGLFDILVDDVFTCRTCKLKK